MVKINENNLTIRKANNSDMDKIMLIISSCQKFLNSNGVDQWQNNYPTTQAIQWDLDMDRGYVVIMDNKVVAFFYFGFNSDFIYDQITNGVWKTQTYAVIHHVAVDGEIRGKGIGQFIFDYCINQAKLNKVQGIRMDTHPDNRIMQHLITKNGFKFATNVQIAKTGKPFMAFEKIL